MNFTGSFHATDRRHSEQPDPYRGPFELDRHRIVECTAFRRLDQKTQVFATTFHDHFRTRLTHTLEVAQIARCLAANLHANEPLCEAIALAHDLGHPPFGHAGEAALNEVMSNHGGFNHNAHSLRVVEYLEHPFPGFRGLNLTWATLEGLQAHATRYDQPSTDSTTSSLSAPTELGFGAAGPNRSHPKDGVSLEARITSLADRLAYNLHDMEDAIGAGLLKQNDLENLPIWMDAFAKANRDNQVKSIFAVRRSVLDAMLDAVLADAIAVPKPFTGLSPECDAELTELEVLLRERVYGSPDVARADTEAQSLIQSLFAVYTQDPLRLPDRFQRRIAQQGRHRVVCDYIAGMTDRFCKAEAIRMCVTPRTPDRCPE